MKLIKLTSLLSLVGLLAVALPERAQAGRSFGFEPFGLVTFNILMVENTKGGNPHKERFNTQALMELVLDAMQSNEGFCDGTNVSFTLPAGAYLYFDGSSFLIRSADGSLFRNLTENW